jgi:hypothetical protein
LPARLPALLVTDPEKGLMAIAMEGMPFEVSPCDERIVVSIGVSGIHASSLLGATGDDGHGTYLSDTNDLAFALYFEDESSGIFVTHIPGPGAALVIVPGVLMVTRRRRTGV